MQLKVEQEEIENIVIDYLDSVGKLPGKRIDVEWLKSGDMVIFDAKRSFCEDEEIEETVVKGFL